MRQVLIPLMFAALFFAFLLMSSCNKSESQKENDLDSISDNGSEFLDGDDAVDSADLDDLTEIEETENEIVSDNDNIVEKDDEATDETTDVYDEEFNEDSEEISDASDDGIFTDEDSEVIELTVNFISVVETGSSVDFSGIAKGIHTVKVIRDNKYEFFSGIVTGDSYSFSYSFNTAGDAEISAKGYNSQGTLLKTVKKTITIKDPNPSVPYLENVPYFYQYSNSINPGGSCQNTSMAMVLKYFGANVTPDEISSYYGTSEAQSVSGWKTVFDSEAAYYGLTQRSTSTTTGTLTNLRTLLSDKKPVVVHGYFTSYGHVMLLLGYDGTYYYAHDPAGKWNQIYQGSGYSGTNSTEGKYIKYGKSALEGAVAPDGNVWMHSF